jgi:hypothetical protein
MDNPVTFSTTLNILVMISKYPHWEDQGVLVVQYTFILDKKNSKPLKSSRMQKPTI